MKKKSLLIIAVIIWSLTACDSLKNEDVVIVNDRLESSVKSSMDLEAQSISQPLKEAEVQGTVKNNSDRTLKNIVITYKIARGTVSAKISLLKPNQTSNFTTSKYKTKDATPKYELESITYSE